MAIEHTTITEPSTFVLHGPGRTEADVAVELVYSSRDPHAVRMVFTGGPGTGGTSGVDWVFSRELLIEGTHRPAGLGDVRIRPSRFDLETVEIELTGSIGRAVLDAPVRSVTSFLARTYELVPVRLEHLWLDLDRLVADLLSCDSWDGS